MKARGLIALIVVVAVLATVLVWWATQPRTPADAFVRADSRQVRVDERLAAVSRGR